MLMNRAALLLAATGLLAGCSGAGPDEGKGAGATGKPLAVTMSAGAFRGSGSGPDAAGLDPAKVQSAWWTWAAGTASGNPVADTTGAHCAVGQTGDLWFLAGTFGGTATRRCTVPAGRTMLAPLVNLISEAGECPAFMTAAKGTLTVDGTARPILRWTGSGITATGVAGNPVTNGAGPFGGTACGLWATVPPLAPGPHKVAIRGSSGDFQVSVDYALTVAES